MHVESADVEAHEPPRAFQTRNRRFLGLASQGKVRFLTPGDINLRLRIEQPHSRPAYVSVLGSAQVLVGQ